MMPLNEQKSEHWMTVTHDQTSLEQLQYPKIIEKLQSLLSTPFGAEALARIPFSCNMDFVRERLIETAEMVSLLEAGSHIPVSGLVEIRTHLNKIKPENAFLESEVLLDVKSTLQLMGEISAFFREHRAEAPGLAKIARNIHYHREIVQEIESTVNATGELYDNASRELRQIRIKIRSLESEQKKVLRGVQKRYAEYSQDEIVTLRDGRLVLGILPNYINKVNGIVHGTSGSGATIFVEPMETLHLSNQVQNLKIQERSEVIKILRFLSDLIRKVHDDIEYGLQNIAALDVILAKAKLSRLLNAAVPKLTTRPRLKIIGGRHPLLMLKSGAEAVVPLTVELGEAFTTLVITGPNAGGKTVAMKSVGLFLLMVQMGLPVPADPDSEIPLLSKILVDIGDRQSLEQDLSTFSAHIVRLQEIIEKADKDSLVLLDEAGTGTDPKEGASLAIAMLETLSQKNIFTIATTHHGELKAFAHSTPGIENGSMEFDLETLQPTYQLRIGVPGSSYAFEIARRYGLSANLIAKARMIVGKEKDKLEELVLSLERRLQEQDKEHRKLSIKLSQAEAMRSLYEQQSERLKKDQALLKRQAAEEARRVLEEANAIIEKSVQEIRGSGASRQAIKSARASVQTKKLELEKVLSAERPQPAEMAVLKKGDIVLIDSLNKKGEMLEDANGKSTVKVLVGNIKMTLDVSRLRKLSQTSSEEPINRRMTGEEIDVLNEGIQPELDLRGLDSFEAIEETDRYLSKAMESDWDEVRIVHGKGTGVLRQKINEYLVRDKRVEWKRPGKWGEGDTGVTVVKLKKGNRDEP